MQDNTHIIERRDYAVAKLAFVTLAGALAQIFGFSFHLRPNPAGLWFFLLLGLAPLVAYAVLRLFGLRRHGHVLRGLTNLAVTFEAVGAIIASMTLTVYLSMVAGMLWAAL